MLVFVRSTRLSKERIIAGPDALSPLISAASLKALLGGDDLALLDATWTYPGGPEPRAEGRIPGAIRFDIDQVADKRTKLPHMLPAPKAFEAAAADLGVGSRSHVVVYDRIHVFTAPRVWWMFRAMGHARVQVLDGGLPAWIAAGGAVEPDPPATRAPLPGVFRAAPDMSRVTSKLQVARWLEDGFRTVVDARSPSRFRGEDPEPRQGLKAGHMPNALNLPWNALVAADGTLKPAENLAAAFAEAGVSADAKLATTCGSGVTAAILALAWEHLGRPPAALYDGSWAEWGRVRGGGTVVSG